LRNQYQEALCLLGHEYAIFGTVEKGIGLGKKLGYPTANVRYNPRKLLPPEGVYTCWADIKGERFEGVMFIGQNHFNPEIRISVEAHLFDVDRDLYGEQIALYPARFLRKNQKYDSPQQLARQIGQDKNEAMQILQKEKQHDADKRTKGSNYCWKTSPRQ